MEFKDILAEVGGFSSGLIQRINGGEQATVVASTFMYAAAMIHKEIGGSKYAAMQFYAAADRLAAE